jgi:hypothetical protein
MEHGRNFKRDAYLMTLSSMRMNQYHRGVPYRKKWANRKTAKKKAVQKSTKNINIMGRKGGEMRQGGESEEGMEGKEE